MLYSLTAVDVETGSSADTFKTMLAIIAGATTGHRGRLLQLQIGPSDDSPADLNLSVKVNRTDQTSAGTAGSSVTAANVPKADPASRDSVMTAGKSYTAEPTVYETEPLWATDFNRRGGLVQTWDRAEAPVWGPSETIGVLAAPRTASAARLTITVVWEEY